MKPWSTTPCGLVPQGAWENSFPKSKATPERRFAGWSDRQGFSLSNKGLQVLSADHEFERTDDVG